MYNTTLFNDQMKLETEVNLSVVFYSFYANAFMRILKSFSFSSGGHFKYLM